MFVDDPVLGQMDPGEPTGICTAVDTAAGVFERRYSKMLVQLHCDTWRAEFAPVAAVETVSTAKTTELVGAATEAADNKGVQRDPLELPTGQTENI